MDNTEECEDMLITDFGELIEIPKAKYERMNFNNTVMADALVSVLKDSDKPLVVPYQDIKISLKVVKYQGRDVIGLYLVD